MFGVQVEDMRAARAVKGEEDKGAASANQSSITSQSGSGAVDSGRERSSARRRETFGFI